MIWGVYKHQMRFEHSVPEAEWLEDKACLIPHKHGRPPNPLCVMEFICATEKSCDFKVLKRLATDSLKIVAHKIIKDEQEADDGRLIVCWEYDFGTITTESLIDDVRKLMLIALEKDGYKPIRVQIWLDETRKYSVWDDGVPPEVTPPPAKNL